MRSGLGASWVPRSPGIGSSLWRALDEVVPELEEWALGAGVGLKLGLLNELLRRAGDTGGWLLVSDDDVSFVRGDVVELVSLCERARLDLAQPARADAAADHAITVARPRSRARRTTFVEIGPMFVVGPRWRDRILPFPEARGMGYGLELDWFDLPQAGCVLGISDAVRSLHEGERGEDYDDAREIDRVHEEFEARGFSGWGDLQHTLGTWRPWQLAPPWSSRGGSAP